MISFVVIGKNIEQTIEKCLKSILFTIEFNEIKNHEIIYVDSSSTDRTLDIAKSFVDISIYKILSNANSAKARNLGFKKSKGSVIFFIDGDMELVPKTLKKIYNQKKGLVYPFISGDWINVYNNKRNYKKINKYHNLKKDTFQYKSGGLFLINRDLWIRVGGMRNVFKRSQDLDLTLRLTKLGYPILRIKDILSIHYTEEYISRSRFFKDLWKGNFLYRGLLYKYNIFNIFMFKEYLIKEITFFSLLFSILMSMFFINYYFLIYPAFLILKFIYKKEYKEFIYTVFRFIVHDFNLLISLLFFWPSEIKYSYKKIK